MQMENKINKDTEKENKEHTDGKKSTKTSRN